jgi:hypothetical protein
LFDILAEKVKAVGRVRELLTAKLPKDTFPVKLCFFFMSSFSSVAVGYSFLDSQFYIVVLLQASRN